MVATIMINICMHVANSLVFCLLYYMIYRCTEVPNNVQDHYGWHMFA